MPDTKAAASKKTSEPTGPDPLQGLRDKKKMLDQKVKDIEASGKDWGHAHDREAALERAQGQLSEVNQALKAAEKS